MHGVLLLDKPLGWSSNQALQKVKGLLGAQKAGHTGTLDPLATGVLPLCFGAATKFSQGQLDADKCYDAVLRLGIKTSTADAEGEVLQERPVRVQAADLLAAVRQFSGPQWQTPPMHSAIKKDGRALYEYARAGVVLQRQARAVQLDDLTLAWLPQDASPASGQPALALQVRCSKGTYIRTLAEDIGEFLGCGAHLAALRRTQTGPFALAQCTTLEAFVAMTEAQRLACLLPVSALLPDHSVLHLGAEDAARFLTGMRRLVPGPDQPKVAVYGPSDGAPALLGVGHITHGELIADRLLSPLEISQMQMQAAAPSLCQVAAAEIEVKPV